MLTEEDIKIAERVARKYRLFSDYDDVRVDAMVGVWNVYKKEHADSDHVRFAIRSARFSVIDGIRHRHHKNTRSVVKEKIKMIAFNNNQHTVKCYDPEPFVLIDEICRYVHSAKEPTIRFILNELLMGSTKQDIALALSITPSMVSYHLKDIRKICINTGNM